MPTSDATRWSSEERALARRLAELDPVAEPSAALDARVPAADQGAPRRPEPRQGRWPAVVGLAALLLLAVGIAWQLRPHAPVGHEPAAANPTRQAGRPLQDAVAEAPRPTPLKATSAAAAPSPPDAVSSSGAHPKQAANAAANTLEPDLVVAVPAQPAATPTSSVPTPPPPSPAPEAVQESQPTAPTAAAVVPAAPDLGMEEEEDAARKADMARPEDEPEDDVPPATADSPVVRDAWLQRIRGLIDHGDLDSARESVHAFEQRYPDFALPEDLRTLPR